MTTVEGVELAVATGEGGGITTPGELRSALVLRVHYGDARRAVRSLNTTML